MSKPKIKSHSCNHCPRSFHKDQGLVDHLRVVHGVGNPSAPVGRRPTLTEIDVTCLECGGEGKLVGGKAIYPHRPDLYAKHFYLCQCGAYCGCHPDSVVPLGHPCGAETRAARRAAHAAFDPLWRGGRMSRSSAYAWLASAIGIQARFCHIGMMSAEVARLVVKAVEQRQGALVADSLTGAVQ